MTIEKYPLDLVATSAKMKGEVGKKPDGARRRRREEMTALSRHLVENQEDRYGVVTKGIFCLQTQVWFDFLTEEI